MASVTRFFHPVLPARKLGVKPVQVTIANDKFVLWRDGSGHAAAFADACPHRKAPLSAGKVGPSGRLECPYHGWNFSADGRGRSPSQPGLKKCDATVMQLVERHGYLWIADPATPRSAFPQMEWDGFRHAGSFSMLFRAPLHVALDNFSEDEHTPWVHTRLGWSARDLESIEFTADNFDDRTEVSYRARQRDTAFRFLIGIRKGDTFNNTWTTHFDPVRTIYSISWSDPRTGQTRGAMTRSAIFMVPETDKTTRFHVFVTTKVVSRRLQLIRPIVDRAAVGLAWWEILDDARFIPTVADTPEDMTGMRLGKFDKPLVRNHKLLRDLYWRDDDKVTPISNARRA
jgi:phenylpropionate dioxygenase-like ring-hydroxylating dioxygenase large terminal subunit